MNMSDQLTTLKFNYEEINELLNCLEGTHVDHYTVKEKILHGKLYYRLMKAWKRLSK